MRLHYRILSVDPAEASIEVRYWTDELSERELRVHQDDLSDQPQFCRTDYNLNLWEEMTGAQIHDRILQHAPVAWLRMKGRVKRGALAMTAAQSLAGETFSVELDDRGRVVEVDITHVLSA